MPLLSLLAALALALVACSDSAATPDAAVGGAAGAPATATTSSSTTTGGSQGGTSGSGGGGAASDGGGGVAPPECAAADDCPGLDDECGWRACVGGVCAMTFADADTPIANQVAGDCWTVVCDGAGATSGQYTPSDLIASSNSCIASEACTMSGPVATAKPNGTPCSETCYIYDANGAWYGPGVGVGVCQ